MRAAIISRSSALLLIALLLDAVAAGQKKGGTQDPYATLGIAKTASMSEIKTAYRKKARETHPDKNRGREEEAEQLFYQVSEAFELLSDPAKKAEYDSGRRRRPQQQQQRGGGGTWGFSNQGGFFFRQTFNHNSFYQQQRQRVSQAQAKAMARVMFITGVDHLMRIAFGANGVVDRHVVLALYDEGACERRLNENTVFPYPFAGMSDDHGMWWEDVIQTTKARMTGPDGKPSELARSFGVDGQGDAACPSIVFARRGGDLWGSFEVLKRPETGRYQAWMWEKLRTNVHFVNRHTHTVRLYWLHGNHAKNPIDIPPGHTEKMTSYLSHLFIARDTRVGSNILTKESSLTWTFIDSDADPFVVNIDSKCVDWHGDCTRWAREGECVRNRQFMEQHCHVACKTCDAKHTPHFAPQKWEL